MWPRTPIRSKQPGRGNKGRQGRKGREEEKGERYNCSDKERAGMRVNEVGVLLVHVQSYMKQSRVKRNLLYSS